MKRVALILVLAGCGSVTAKNVDGGPGTGGESTGGSHGGGGTSGAAGGGGTGGTGAGGDGVAGAGGGAQLGTNLIGNSTFDAGEAGWSFTPQVAGYGTATTTISAGQFCATLIGDSSGAVATIGWPAANTAGFSLPAGAMFQFSFEASSTENLQSFLDKVGGAATNSTDFQSTTDVLTNSLQPFTHVFTSAGDTDAGVAFVFSSSTTAATTVCVANVKLQQLE